ncbi:hypothetical protein [uncultured Aquimarina sp.]|uniref:hypothetical protein n=1 Tax=uncultured Aquimarina sp. TaxID=575652 RepID=UPI0026397CB3|nr:hypothetical protein [uncultured Aquimarina sp.]
MKTRVPKMLFVLLLTSVFSVSCSSDDTDDVIVNDNLELLFDKWWFDEADFTADIYFSSDNTYRQNISLFGNDVLGEGNWQWFDQAAGIIEVTNLSGQGQTVSGGLYKISSLTATSFMLEISFDDGETYTDGRVYIDTDD